MKKTFEAIVLSLLLAAPLPGCASKVIVSNDKLGAGDPGYELLAGESSGARLGRYGTP